MYLASNFDTVINYTWGYSRHLHNAGFSMEECEQCNNSIRNIDDMVYMFVDRDEDTGDCTIEYDFGFFCSTDCLVNSMQLYEVTEPPFNYQDSIWEEE
jgi:hypothetical protein